MSHNHCLKTIMKVSVSFFKWHISICGLSNTEDVQLEEQLWVYLKQYLGDKEL